MTNFAELLNKAMTEASIGNEKLATCIRGTQGEGISSKTITRWRRGEENKKGKPYTPSKRLYILDMIKPLRLAQKSAGFQECNWLLKAADYLPLNEPEQNTYFPNLPNLSEEANGDRVPVPEKLTVDTKNLPQENALLNRVRGLSQLAMKDAGEIDKLENEAIFLEELYVTRSVEKETLNPQLVTVSDDFKSLIVIGEAGAGKTSLLWRAYQTANRTYWEPWFLKATFFTAQSASQSSYSADKSLLTFEDIKQAVKATALTQAIKPLILLDTVDLLLHDDIYRYEIRLLMNELPAMGCSMVLTCRPQEFEQALKNKFDYQSIYLKDYDDEELIEAVDKHVSRFYAFADAYKREEALKKINDAVALGLPLREVCLNPLTLRILFTLYAPEDVPEEINVFELYKSYWENRVEQDKRAGSDRQTSSEVVNLANTAIIVALIMLAEGSPEVDKRLLQNGLDEFQGSWQDVERLVARGVLHHSTGMIRFFHQTFFEHSAAQGMLEIFRQTGLTLLEDYVKTKQYDLFVLPIYEHALLLAEPRISPQVRRQADEGLLRLLQESNIAAKNAAIYVYVHRSWIPDKETSAIDQKMFAFLQTESTAAIDDFLKLASNMPKQRSKVLFAILDMIWQRGISGSQHHSLDLIERLASREPKPVKDFLDSHQLLEYVLNKNPKQDYTRHFLRILALLARQEPDWCWAHFLNLYRNANNTELKSAILKILCRYADAFGKTEIANRFEKAVGDLLQKESKKIKEPNTYLGKLLSIQWQARQMDLTEILAELNSRTGIRYKMALNGVVEILLTAHEKDIDEAFAYFKQEPDIERQTLWGTITWSKVLKENHDNICVKERLCQHIAQSLHQCVDKSAMPMFKGFCKSLQIAIKEGQLADEMLLMVLNSPQLHRPEPWLDKSGFGQFLAQAFVAGHAGAFAAIEQIQTELTQLPTKASHMSNALCSGLKTYIPEHSQATSLFIKIVLKTENIQELLQLFERTENLLKLNQLSVPLHPTIELYVKDIAQFAQKLLNSPSGKNRRHAYTLWIHLLRSGQVELPIKLEELTHALNKEDDKTVQGWIIVLIGYATLQGFYQVEKTYDLLLPLYQAQNENLRHRTFLALTLALLNSASPPQFAFKLLEIATDGEHLRHFGYILESLILTGEKHQAVELFKKLAIKVTNSDLGMIAKRNFTNRLRKPVSLLFRSLSLEQQEQLLDIMPQLDRFAGRLLIEAACSVSFDKLRDKLQRLMNHPEVVEETRELIRRHEYMRGRTVGAEGWSGLYELLKENYNRRGASR